MRIVSLCPSLTELVFDLGAGEELVGRTKFCVHPAKLVDGVEKVGGTKNPKVARIIELAPDLVLMNEEENRKEDAEALSAAGLRVLSSFARDPAGAASALRELGEAIGANEAGRELAAQIDSRIAEVRARAALSDLKAALRYLPRKRPSWPTRVLSSSGTTGDGVDAIWDTVLEHRRTLEAGGELAQLRAEQQGAWMWSLIGERLERAFRAGVAAELDAVEAEVRAGSLSPTAAADRLLARFGVTSHD